MGDEMHQRNVACTGLFLREIAPGLARTFDAAGLAEVLAFIAGNDQFFLNIAMRALSDGRRAFASSAMALIKSSVFMRLPVVVVLTAVAAYVPYLSAGTGVFGYLWGYVEEEGLASGRGFNLLWLLETYAGNVPTAAGLYLTIAAALMLALCVGVAFRRDRSPQTATACLSWLLVTFLVLASPHYPWYFVALVPLLAIHPSATGWVLTLSCPLLYASVDGVGWPSYDVRIATFTVATAVALAYDAWRLRQAHIAPSVGEAPWQRRRWRCAGRWAAPRPPD